MAFFDEKMHFHFAAPSSKTWHRRTILRLSISSGTPLAPCSIHSASHFLIDTQHPSTICSAASGVAFQLVEAAIERETHGEMKNDASMGK